MVRWRGALPAGSGELRAGGLAFKPPILGLELEDILAQPLGLSLELFLPVQQQEKEAPKGEVSNGLGIEVIQHTGSYARRSRKIPEFSVGTGRAEPAAPDYGQDTAALSR